MSTTRTPAPLASLDAELNEMILGGKVFEAIDRFYADDVVMQENFQPETSGKAANVEREKAFFGSIETFHGATLHASTVGDGVTASEWTFDATYKAGGRVPMRQVAVRRWKDGQVVHERFYYDGSH